MSADDHMGDDAAPRGTICLAVYRPNLERLRKQIDSIRRQSLSDWTCLIAIDGADDHAETAIADIVGGDGRFEVHAFADNVGFYRNFERLLGLVRPDADWVALSDQDDVWYHSKLETLVPTLDRAMLVTGSARLVDGHGDNLGRTHRRFRGVAALMIDNQVTGSLAVFRRSILDTALPFPEPTDVAYHDHWLGIVAVCLGDIVIDQRDVQDYVQHEGNVIGEERSHRPWRGRFRHLGAASKSQTGSPLRYLAQHRWGWRVSMARLMIERLPVMERGAKQALPAFAQGRCSSSLFRLLLNEVASRRVPAARAAALFVGSMMWSDGAASSAARTRSNS